jgi:hypothetical protein
MKKLVRWSMLTILAGSAACGNARVSHDDRPDPKDDAGDPQQPDSRGDAGDKEDGGPLAPEPDGGSGEGEDAGDGGDHAPRTCDTFLDLPVQPASDLMIVLDRSQSMSEGSAWADAVTGVKGFASERGTLELGLMLFPDRANQDADLVAECGCTNGLDPACLDCIEALNVAAACWAGKVDVPIASDNADAIAAVLDVTAPRGGTPTGPTLAAAQTYLRGAAKEGRAQTIVLITDGQSTCPNAQGLVSATEEELAADHELTLDALDDLSADGVHTFVIGFAGAAAKELLDEYAQHGGTNDRELVVSQSGLERGLREIRDALTGGCSLMLDAAWAGLTPEIVRLDGTEVPADDQNGWTRGGTSLTLHGAACASFQDGSSHKLTAKPSCD